MWVVPHGFTQTCKQRDERPRVLLWDLFLRILACRYWTLASAAVEKKCSQTSSLTWATLEAMRAISDRLSRTAARGRRERESSSLGLGRHFFSNRLTE